MKLAAAPIFVLLYAAPALPLAAAWWEMPETMRVPHRFVRPTLIGATISFLWLYSGCFTQALLGPPYSTTREVILNGNLFGCLVIIALACLAKPRIQIFTAIATATTAFLWFVTTAVSSAA